MTEKKRSEFEVMAKIGVKKEAGYLYFLQCKECGQNRFVSKKCRDPETHFFEIWRKMGTKKEKVADGGIHCEIDYTYFINKIGDIARLMKV